MSNKHILAAAASPDLKVGDTDFNAEQIILTIREGDSSGVSLLSFPKLCITGASCGDLFSHSLLIKGANKALEHILNDTADCKLSFVVSYPVFKHDKTVCAYSLCQGGRILFSSDSEEEPTIFEHEGVKLGFVFDDNAENINILAHQGAELVVSMTAQPCYAGMFDEIKETLKYLSTSLDISIIRADAGEGESSTDGVYGGYCMLFSKGSSFRGSHFTSSLISENLDVSTPVPKDLEPVQEKKNVSRFTFLPEDKELCDLRCNEIFEICSRGLKRRMVHTGAKHLVLGLSGGLDSTLAALTCYHAMELLGLPASNVLAVTMPGFGTTSRTKGNAELLAEGLGFELKCIDITPAVRQHFNDIGHDENIRNAVYENAQARERTQILMDFANALGGLVVGTGDMSELALGWATYNGDHMSMYAVNAGIPKTVVRRIVEWYCETKNGENIANVLLDIVATPVSPELLPADGDTISQITEDLVGPYELHDFFLWHFLKEHREPKEIFTLAVKAFYGIFNEDTILKWLKTFIRRFFSQQYKRSCMPDGPAVFPISLSPRGGLSMPSDAVSNLWLRELE